MQIPFSRTLRCAVGAGLVGLCCTAAQAQLNTIKVGGILYQPHSTTDGIRGIGVPPGADVDIGSAPTLMLAYERALTPRLGLELVFGIPPKLKAKATGTVAFLGDDVVSARNVSPTLFLSWHFGEPGDRLRPYASVGINYTTFASIRSRIADKVDMSDSTGLALAAGFDYFLTDTLSVFGAIARLDVRSKLVATGATVLETNINFRPLTYSLGLAYRY